MTTEEHRNKKLIPQKHFELNDKNIEHGMRYLQRRLENGDFLNIGRDFELVNKGSFSTKEKLKLINEAINFRLNDEERKRMKNGVNSAIWRENHKRDNLTRLEVKLDIGNKVRKAAIKRNISVSELLDDAINNYWKD